MTSRNELRKLALDKRRENSNERKELYVKARDEAFELLTDGVMERIKNAAMEGRFRYPIYRWTNKSRNQTTETIVETSVDDESKTGVPEATQLYFGSDENGKNGLHIMALMQPTGVAYEDMLVSKLREFFNSLAVVDSDGAGTQAGNHMKVYLRRRPNNPRQWSIFVSWDSHQSNQTQGPRRVFNPRRPHTVPVPGSVPIATSAAHPHPHPSPSEQTTEQRPRTNVLRPQFRGAVPFRGTPSFRGGAPRGRGRLNANTGRQ